MATALEWLKNNPKTIITAASGIAIAEAARRVRNANSLYTYETLIYNFPKEQVDEFFHQRKYRKEKLWEVIHNAPYYASLMGKTEKIFLDDFFGKRIRAYLKQADEDIGLVKVMWRRRFARWKALGFLGTGIAGLAAAQALRITEWINQQKVHTAK